MRLHISEKLLPFPQIFCLLDSTSSSLSILFIITLSRSGIFLAVFLWTFSHCLIVWMEALTEVQLHLLLSVNPENLVFIFGNFKNFLSEMEDFITFLSTALLFKSDCAVALAD